MARELLEEVFIDCPPGKTVYGAANARGECERAGAGAGICCRREGRQQEVFSEATQQAAEARGSLQLMLLLFSPAQLRQRQLVPQMLRS